MADRRFFYRSWSARTRYVEGVADVEFTSEHVVFRNEQGVILLAEKNSDVGHLREDTTGLPLAEARTQYVEELP